MEENNPNQISQKLDRLAMKILELINTMLSKRSEQESFMKAGFLNLAESRYSMGNKAVSLLQISNRNFDPVLTVNKEDAINDLNVEFDRMYLATNSETPVDVNKTENSNIRLRKNTEKVNQDLEEKPQKKIKHNDPIKWFGVLVPHSLKQCQKNFTKSLHLSTELATLQVEMQKCKEEFDRLKSIKISLNST